MNHQHQQETKEVFETKGYASAVCFLLTKGYDIFNAEECVNKLRLKKLETNDLTVMMLT